MDFFDYMSLDYLWYCFAKNLRQIQKEWCMKRKVTYLKFFSLFLSTPLFIAFSPTLIFFPTIFIL